MCALAMLAPRAARANGLELPDNGSVSMGRGGAFVARASDPTAIEHNVAAIVGLPGTQITIGANASVFNHCFARAGNYPGPDEAYIDNAGTIFADSHYADGGVPYPRVCQDSGPTLTPHLFVTHRFNPYVAVGIGIWGPNTTGAQQHFAETVMTDAGLAPSPVRDMVYDKSLLLFHVPLAAAFAPTRWLRFGVALEPSYANFSLSTMVNTMPMSAQSPASDVRFAIHASGLFLAGNFGVHVIPSRYFTFGADLHVNSTATLRGNAEVSVNYYAANPRDRLDSTIDVTRMSVPLPWDVRAGARFAMPRAGRDASHEPGRGTLYDPMVDDLFDVEATFTYEATSTMGLIALETAGRIDVGFGSIEAPARVEVRSNVNDVLGARLGGDVNVIPGRLALRAGVAYSTRAESTMYAQIHLPGYETTSVHVGLSLRVAMLTLSAGYAHYFMSPLDAVDGARSVISVNGAVTPDQCAGSAGAGACAINQGLYTASLDTITVGLSARF